MTLQEAKLNLKKACDLIFEVEKNISADSDNSIRKQGYRCRIAIGQYMDTIKNSCDTNNISKGN